MALTRTSLLARTSSAGNPISQSVTVPANCAVIVVLLNVVGASVRAGGSLTFNGATMRQANTTQRGVTSPEASAEIWYLDVRDKLPKVAGSYTLVIPNTGALTIKFTVEGATAPAGSKSRLAADNGANATAINPSPGAMTVGQSGAIAWAVVASGAQTWAPSAQGGTAIANTDDGATGGGEQYSQNPALGTLTLNWTFATSEDYGAVAALFYELPPPNIQDFMGPSGGGDVIQFTERTPNLGPI